MRPAKFSYYPGPNLGEHATLSRPRKKGPDATPEDFRLKPEFNYPVCASRDKQGIAALRGASDIGSRGENVARCSGLGSYPGQKTP